MGRPVLCKDCCRRTHSKVPFHRVEQWTGEFFKPSWLHEVGVEIYLGHSGAPCPLGAEVNPLEDCADMEVDDPDEDSEWGDDDERGTERSAPHPFSPFTDTVNISATSPQVVTLLCIVDRSGIHHLPVRWCRCSGHAIDEHQLFSMGLFPSSFKRIKTAFTFQVLDDFRIDNLECKTAAFNYYRKLRRLTSNAFPESIKVGF
jgi:hypothetical protein